MNSETRIWLVYSGLGLVVAVSLVMIMKAMPWFTLISTEAVVFATMTTMMSAAIRRSFKTAKSDKQEH